MNIVFWQPTVSIHQAPLLRNLALLGHDVHLVCDSDVSPARLSAGWQRPNYGEVEVHVSPSEHSRRQLERRLLKADLHVFSGLGAYRLVEHSMREIVTAGGKGIAYVEMPDPEGIRGAVRSIHARSTARAWRARLLGLLAVGSMGVNYYRARGHTAQSVYPYAYFMDQTGEFGAQTATQISDRALFVGLLVKRKRPLQLASAVAETGDLKMDYIGDGPLRGRIQSEFGGDRQTLLGTLSNEETRRRMAIASFLVLPSRFDGWGAVVSESLLAGTPVLVSPGCGASDLVVSSRLGAIASGGLTQPLVAMASRSAAGDFDRPSIARWARGALSGEAGADYLLRILRHMRNDGVRPSPPWSSTAGLE